MVLPIKRTTNGDLSQLASGDPLTLTVDGTGAVVSPTDLDSFAAASGATMVGVDTTNLPNSAPGATDLQTVLEALDAASGGGGVTDMQGAYDGGPDITLDATGAIDIVDAATNADPYVLSIDSTAGAAAKNAVKVVRNPTVANTLGDGINVSLGSNSAGEGVAVVNAGVGRPAQFDGTGATTQATRITQAFGNANPALEVDHAGGGGGIVVTHSSGSGVTVNPGFGGGVALDVNVPFSGATLGLDITQAGNAGGAQIVVSNISSFAPALDVQHAGSGNAVVISTTGSGDGLSIDTAAGSGGIGAAINVLAGNRAIAASVAGTNVLSVDDAECKIGDSAQVVLVQAHGRVVLGSAAGAEAKTFDARTTDAATTLTPTNNLGRIVTRPGVNTAASTIAELAYQAGSAAAETLLTKGGRLYATAAIREFVIENGETLAPGDVVAPSATATRVGKADPITANGFDNAIGICLVGGTGTAGIVRALIAMGGYVDGLAGLTANTPVYLDDTTPGLLTSTVPSASGSTSIRIGFATSQSSVVIHVGEKILIP